MHWSPLSFRPLGLVLIASMWPLASGCKPTPPTLRAPLFSDSFDRQPDTNLGDLWLNTAAPGTYRIAAGALHVQGAHNHPLWLKQPLPRDVVVELDAWSDSPQGDIKVEIFGDGKSYAQSVSYTSTGYVLIHGGWQNRLSALCRMNEHSDDRKVREQLKVTPGKRYHYLIARRGNKIEWFIDGELALDLDDDAPLDGPAHAHFGFDNWETSVHFDNLVIRPAS